MVNRTLLDLIRGDCARLTRASIARWRRDNPAYGDWPLSTLFTSGSAVAIRGESRLDRAASAWTSLGRGRPAGPEFAEFAAEYLDEFDDEFYER